MMLLHLYLPIKKYVKISNSFLFVTIIQGVGNSRWVFGSYKEIYLESLLGFKTELKIEFFPLTYILFLTYAYFIYITTKPTYFINI